MFESARIKLTLWYLTIIMLISISFSTAIYTVLSREFERFSRAQRIRMQLRFGLPLNSPRPYDPELLEEAKTRLVIILLGINGAILVLAGGVGYFLAERTLKPIKEMVDEQHRFISDASHELRTPLTSLKTAMEVFLREKGATLQNAKKLIAENIIEVDRLVLLSNSLLQLAQYQTSTKQLFEKTAFDMLINEAIHKVSPLAKNKRISIRSDLTPGYVNANKNSLLELIVIVLDNAIKYSPIKSHISVTLRAQGDHLFLRAKDEGMGIEDKDLPFVFDRFYRADKSRSKQKTDGFGLGLSIAKEIVEAHNGSIAISKNIDKGITVTIGLPISKKSS